MFDRVIADTTAMFTIKESKGTRSRSQGQRQGRFQRKIFGGGAIIEAPKAPSVERQRQKAPSVVEYGGLEQHCKLPQRDPGEAPAGSAFWRILKAKERPILLL